MTPEPLRFTPELLRRDKHSLLDVATTLRHFAIITYAVEPLALQTHLHPRFVPDCITTLAGQTAALVSVVPFLDVDFCSAICWTPRLSFGQTNYRAYVRDTETGHRVAWFFGTCLDSWTIVVPRHVWKLPWHSGSIRFACDYSEHEGRYVRYEMQTRSKWAPASLDLADSGVAVAELEGFDDLESALVLLTHPLEGFYFRRDGRLGTYHVWHDRLHLTSGRLVHAEFPLLDRLKLVPLANQSAPHSVLLQHETQFAIYLPPRPVSARD